MNSKMIANGILRAVGIMVLVVLSLYALSLLKSILIYIVLALIITLLGKPFVFFFHRRLKIRSKSVCVILTMTIFIILSLGVFSLFIPLLISQGKNLSGLNIDLLRTNLDNLLLHFFKLTGVSKDEEETLLSVSDALNFIDIPNLINSFISFIGSFGAGLFSVLFITFFFMKNNTSLMKSTLSLLPNSQVKRTRTSIVKINSLLSRYFAGLILQLTILFVIYTIVLLIFGVQNPFIIAFLCALLNLIPYIGPIIAFVLMALLTMSSNIDNDFMSVTLPTTIYVLIGFLIGQFIDNVFSQPLIFSNSVKSSPLEIFLIILICGTLFGVIGMVIAIPAYTVLKVILKEFLPNNKIVKILTKNF
ncbi:MULTISPECIES: AI-2E family transporter [Capnocytophaga]|uniref:AI-2E family transporter n=1 Tax=Capnocytophaga TaxID=1016 RepID=UPI000BB192D1|nr:MULTISPECIES: AI-2E family transporter [Capnocytophaga]ATA75390.1 AI-2E family transporter [Capnocytophaga sp. H2931]